VNAKGGHALQKPDSVGDGDFKVGLLHPIPKTCLEELDFSGSSFFHFSLTPIAKVLIAEDGFRSRVTSSHDTSMEGSWRARSL
jgi:hypothetical protein